MNEPEAMRDVPMQTRTPGRPQDESRRKKSHRAQIRARGARRETPQVLIRKTESQ